MKKGVQYFSKEYLERCKGATPDQIIEFLENYRMLIANREKMKDPLLQKVNSFLASRFQPGGPFLLGYSGGPDSKALLYLLLQCRQLIPFELCLAHVDHGWRAESSVEAEAIAEEAAQLGLRLFVRKLSPGELQKNLEAYGRQQRLLFFQEIYHEIQAQGLFLAHQADDQAETVLKRLLEGAHLTHLSGIDCDGKIEEMRVLRPLLHIEKKELLAWLEKQGKKAFEDPTNLSSRFLRGRMRSEMIPTLTSQFGKEISLNLCKAGASFSEIHDYLRRRCEPYWASLTRTEDGIHWDLSEIKEPLELKWLLKNWLDQEELSVSYEVMLRIVEGVFGIEGPGAFPIQTGVLSVKKGHLRYIWANSKG